MDPGLLLFKEKTFLHWELKDSKSCLICTFVKKTKKKQTKKLKNVVVAWTETSSLTNQTVRGAKRRFSVSWFKLIVKILNIYMLYIFVWWKVSVFWVNVQHLCDQTRSSVVSVKENSSIKSDFLIYASVPSGCLSVLKDDFTAFIVRFKSAVWDFLHE